MRVHGVSLTLVALCIGAVNVDAQRAPRPVLKLSVAEQEALGAMLHEVLAQLPDSSTLACIVLRGGPPRFWYAPDSMLLGTLRSASRSVLTASDCPPTYDVMYVLRDSAGNVATPRRPPGYVDPYVMQVQEHGVIASDSASAIVRVSQGTLNRGYICSARYRHGRWQSSCRFTGVSVSRMPPNETLQPTSARTSEGLLLTTWRVARARRQVSRIFRRPLAAELSR